MYIYKEICLYIWPVFGSSIPLATIIASVYIQIKNYSTKKTIPNSVRKPFLLQTSGVVLVTDAMAALGLGDGLHQIGQLGVEVKGRRAFLRGTETLAGSIAPMNECIRRFVKAAGVGLVEGVQAASLHPAQALGLGSKGKLSYGADADLVFLDSAQTEAVEVLHTLIAGECVYSAPRQEPLVFIPT